MKSTFSITLRKTDKAKIKVIADENSRSLSGQIEFLIKQHIEKYEEVRGKISTDNLKDDDQ